MCALIRILLLEQDGENLNRRVELQHIGTAPALKPCDSDTGLRIWLACVDQPAKA